MRITTAHLVAAHERYARAADKVWPGLRTVLQHGSTDTPWRLYEQPEGTTGYTDPPTGDSLLGHTKRDALDTLLTLAQCVEKVGEAARAQGIRQLAAYHSHESKRTGTGAAEVAADIEAKDDPSDPLSTATVAYHQGRASAYTADAAAIHAQASDLIERTQ